MNKGFTLVELAIVMTIIGLLIGGILKGQQLMENARITKTVSQVDSYKAAITTFKDKYSANPGDFAVAVTKLPNCDGITCVNGDSNGFVGLTDLLWRSVDSITVNENIQFWNHLVLSGLISGITPNSTTNEWGKSNPISPISGGFHVRHADIRGGFVNNGHYLVMRNDVRGTWMCGGGSNTVADCVISPKQAWQIDKKVDDGTAYSGTISAISASHSNGCGNANLGDQDLSGYNITDSKKTCDIFFKVD